MNRLITLTAAAWIAALAGCSGGTVQPTCTETETLCGTACVDTGLDPRHCGACDAACGTGEVCTGGACQTGCPSGQADCDGACFDLDTSRSHCGACGNACAEGEACTGGTCQTSCPAAQSACDGTCRDLQTDRAHCGACGTACAVDEVCSAGGCALVCATGLDDCGGTCRDTGSDRAHCGACGSACGDGELCVSGSCVLTCTGFASTICSGACTNTQVDPANCGACDNACATGQVCALGTCATGCAPSQDVCGGLCTSTAFDPSNCGTCNNACPTLANAFSACAEGACGAVCLSGYADCDADLASSGSTGCETNLQTTLAHCGACGNVCPAVANGTAGCAGGACGIAACSAGFDDCDGALATGCEATLATDDDNCGTCGNVCAAGDTCISGTCETLAGDTCADAVTITAGANTVNWVAVGREYLSIPICGSSTALAGPDLVLRYTAPITGLVAITVDKPTSTRWATIASSGTCGNLTPQVDCMSEFTAAALNLGFAVTLGETYFIYLVDTTSGTLPLSNPLSVAVAETSCATFPAFEVTTVVPAGATVTAEAAPAVSLTTSRAINRTAGTVTLTGSLGTTRSYPLTSGQVTFSTDGQVLNIATSAFQPGEQVSFSFSGVVDEVCSDPLAPLAATFTTPAAACGPFGPGAVAGNVTERIGIGGGTITESYVAADGDPNGYVYYGGTAALHRVPKAGGTREDVEALAGLGDADLGFTMLIDGQNIYTVDSSTTKTTDVVIQISSNGGATFSRQNMVTFPAAPADDIAGIAVSGGTFFMITHEATTATATQIWTASTNPATAPNSATLLTSFGASTYNNCRGMALDSQNLYTICRKGTATTGSNHHVLRINGVTLAITELPGFPGNTTAAGAVYGVDGNADGIFDLLYVRTNQREVYFMCNVSSGTPHGDVFVRLNGSSTSNHGLGYDPVANTLWAYEDLTSTASGQHELLRIQ